MKKIFLLLLTSVTLHAQTFSNYKQYVLDKHNIDFTYDTGINYSTEIIKLNDSIFYFKVYEPNDSIIHISKNYNKFYNNKFFISKENYTEE